MTNVQYFFNSNEVLSLMGKQAAHTCKPPESDHADPGLDQKKFKSQRDPSIDYHLLHCDKCLECTDSDNTVSWILNPSRVICNCRHC